MLNGEEVGFVTNTVLWPFRLLIYHCGGGDGAIVFSPPTTDVGVFYYFLGGGLNVSS